MSKVDTPTDTLTASALVEVDSVHESLAVLIGRLRTIKGNREALDKEARELRERPLSRADIKAAALAWVDECGAQYAAASGLGGVVEKFALPQRQQNSPDRGHMNIDRLDAIAGRGAGALSLISSDARDFFYSSDGFNGQHFSRFYFFFGEAIKAKVSEAFDAWSKDQPKESADVSEPLASRRTKLADLAARDDVLLAEEAGINSRLISLRSAIQRVV